MNRQDRPLGEARRRLTTTVAGVAFGAAIGLCLLYWPRALDVTGYRCGRELHWGWIDGLEDGPPGVLGQCKIVAFDRVVVEGVFPAAERKALVRTWKLRVVGALLLVGGLIGGLVGSHRFWAKGPPPRLRFWQRLLGPAAIFVALVLIGPPWSYQDSLFVRVADRSQRNPSSSPPIPLGEAVAEAIGLALLAIIIGTAGTTVVTAWGKLLPWSLPDQADDYDDRARPSRPAPA